MRRRKRLHRRELKRQRKIIMLSLFTLLLCLMIGYASFSTNISLSAKGNLKDKSRVIQSWTSSSNEDFHTDFYRKNIISATFLDSGVVPNDAIESWDVSESKDNGVIAYVVESTIETGKYDLYIGAKKGVIANPDSSWLFYNFSGMKNITFNNNFDTSNTTNMYALFCQCINLETIDLSSFDTSNVTNMSTMFVANTATPMTIKKIEFGENFNTSNVKYMSAMFGNCVNLTNLDLSSFNTSNVISMYDMFSGCNSLESIDLSNFNTSNVTSMHGMFYMCKNLTELNLCNFNTLSVTDMNLMFTNSSNLKTIYVGSKWTTENASTGSMFFNAGVSSVTMGKCSV